MNWVIETPQQWIQLAYGFRQNGESIGFVPTMGALHDGHLTLIRRSLQENDHTLVSIFVNPTQFNDPKDLKNYPRTLQSDINSISSIGEVHILTPSIEQMYPDSYKYKISENDLANNLCGLSRPGHFDGVLTVVMKLLQVAHANRAYFGEKDFQQYLLIKGMAEAFFLDTEIISIATVREADGLAMSSRNMLLSASERTLAPILYKILKNSTDVKTAKLALVQAGFNIDYVEEKFGRRFAAVRLGQVRLIDNVQL